MFKYSVSTQFNRSDFILGFLSMTYVTMVVLSIVLFDQILHFSLFGMPMTLSGAVVPYVFLYPISFIVLRVYGLRQVNNMIACMILVSLLFVLMATLVAKWSSNTTGIHDILMSSIKMYIAGFIGMPAGIYTSFLVLKWFAKMKVGFNVFSLTIATIVGEVINTVIVFPVGFHGQYSLPQIIGAIILDALIFKIVMGAILAVVAIMIIHFLINKKVYGVQEK